MRSFQLSLGVILMFFCSEVFSQGFVENALLFSRTKPGGSARIQGMGGAQVALGGDYSSALANPAGLGMFNRSEFTFSPGLNFYTSESGHLGNNDSDSKTVLTIPGVSLVWNKPAENGKFLGGSFGISLSRINDFQNSFQYGTNTSDPSIIDYFVQDANAIGSSTADFENNVYGGDIRTQLAYYNFLVEDSSYYSGSPQKYFSLLGTYPDDPDDIRHFNRVGNVDIKGAQYQLSLAYGGNVSDQFFFGGSVGVTTLRYRFKSLYRESNYSFELSPSYNPLDYLQLEETIDVEGSGINLTLGVIWRPVNFVQIGASLLTPTFYALTDTYTATLKTQWNNFDYYGDGSRFLNSESDRIEPLISEYNITTPLKFSTGIAFFVGKYGFITGDVEFINYGKSKYSSDTPDVSFNPENNEIRSSFTDVINTRVGAELRYDVFRIRGGYALQANPYEQGVSTTNYKQNTISFGAGLRFDKFFIDVAWLQATGKSVFNVYGFSDGTGPITTLKNTLTSTMITAGFNF